MSRDFEHRIVATETAGEVSALWHRPRGAQFLYVFAHGAGAGMTHEFMASMTARLSDRKVATFRFQFPYMEAGRRRPDPPAMIEATIREAVKYAGKIDPKLPMIAGGKSMGGRLTSSAQARAPLPAVVGLAFTGFPLHPAAKPSVTRAEHLDRIKVPMLFLQGTRDALADLELVRPVCKRLGRRAHLHIVDGADHGFRVLKRSGRTGDEVLDELADTLVTWSQSVLG